MKERIIIHQFKGGGGGIERGYFFFDEKYGLHGKENSKFIEKEHGKEIKGWKKSNGKVQNNENKRRNKGTRNVRVSVMVRL